MAFWKVELLPSSRGGRGRDTYLVRFLRKNQPHSLDSPCCTHDRSLSRRAIARKYAARIVTEHAQTIEMEVNIYATNLANKPCP